MVEKAILLDDKGVPGQFILVLQRDTHLSEERLICSRNNFIVQLVGNICNRKVKKGRPSGHDFAQRLNKMPHFIAEAARSQQKLPCVQQQWKQENYGIFL